MIGIYKIKSPIGKIYIGQSVNIKKRLITYRNNFCKSQPRLRNSIAKYGWDSHIFEVIEECDIDVLNIRERYWQEHYKACGIDGLNCMLTTDGNVASRHSDETRAKISKANKGINRYVKTQEVKDKISKSLTGVKLSEDRVEQIRLRMMGNTYTKGIPASKETKLKISKALIGNKYRLGHKHSEERKRQISEQHKGNKYNVGRKSSEETKIRISESSQKAILIFNTETGIFYNSLKAASDSINSIISSAHISRMIKGKWPNKTSFIFA